MVKKLYSYKILCICVFVLLTLNAQTTDLTNSSELRKLLLSQPDYVATPEFNIEGINSWVERVMKRGEMYRFEIVNKEEDGTNSQMIVLAYPGKKIKGFLPKEKTWWYMEETIFHKLHLQF